MEDVHTVKNFYGVYLLYCTNPKYYGRTYIGFTVDPNRRVKQHNKGKKAGGAWKTSNRGPWSMVLIIHGFPNDISALRFEWAWQHPQSSRRLNHLTKKKPKEKSFDYCLRVLAEMLTVGPWNRLPLTIRWLNQEYAQNFPVSKTPPLHMPILYGSVVSKKLDKTSTNSQGNDSEDDSGICSICKTAINDKKLSCLNSKCALISHMICLANYYKTESDYVPVEGKCPFCAETYLWGDIIRKYKGCYNNCDIKINTNNAENDFYSSDSE